MASKPTIVILDGYTTNPGDLSWDGLAALGDLVVHERTDPSELAARVKGAEVIVSNKVRWDETALREATSCKMIQLLSTGFNVVDFDVANELGITVCNVPAYSTPDVAQHAFALILETTNHVNDYSESVRLGNWITSRDFTYYIDPLMELTGKTLGIIGMGAIGQRVARIATAFGMKVIYFSTSGTGHCKEWPSVSLDTLLRESDAVSIHAPLNERTAGLIGAEELKRMKPSAFLINMGRGGIVDEEALVRAVDNGTIAGAALDVYTEEPLPLEHPLLYSTRMERFRFTPHTAWASVEARGRLVAGIAANIEKGW